MSLTLGIQNYILALPSKLPRINLQLLKEDSAIGETGIRCDSSDGLTYIEADVLRKIPVA